MDVIIVLSLTTKPNTVPNDSLYYVHLNVDIHYYYFRLNSIANSSFISALYLSFSFGATWK